MAEDRQALIHKSIPQRNAYEAQFPELRKLASTYTDYGALYGAIHSQAGLPNAAAAFVSRPTNSYTEAMMQERIFRSMPR